MFLSKKYSSTNLLSAMPRNKKRFGSSRRRRKNKKVKFELIPLVTAKKGFVASRTNKGLLDYKNVILLRQFLSTKGTILPRAKTRLTANEQRKVARTIKTARILGLLPFVRR